MGWQFISAIVSARHQMVKDQSTQVTHLHGLKPKAEVKDLSFYYGAAKVLKRR
jgi:hypothetical protein